ncbi:hypothetical protein DCCM_0016 [Desulfocucumis palustris]|uniref:Uncharacterized protein n=1 Tax=Desulfocucumis palustris TaxID=1898651 RepID=A0A2L2X797_9FIRM|nr:protein DpdD [Desulfocucumis palustris]GBF31832.1 hypothetical protein DCCM_0016 [Desulfocucumis palustris]
MNRIVIDDTDLQNFITAALQVNKGNPYGIQLRGGEIICSHQGLTAMLRRCQAGKTFVLPVRRQRDVLWLVLSGNLSEFLKHVDELKSFLVPTLAEPLLAGRSKFDPTKSGMGLLGAQLFPHGYYCFRSPLSLSDQIFKALAIWDNLDSLRPEMHVPDTTVNAYVLRRKFQQAVVLQHWDEAELALTTIRHGHYLSDENCLFLKVQLLSSQGKWHALWEGSEYPLVAGLDPLPVTVRGALLMAFYNCAVVNLEEQEFIPAILDVFRQYSGKLGTLLRYRAGLSGNLFVRLFAYQAAVENQAPRLRQLAGAATEKATQDIINVLLTLVAVPSPAPAQINPLEQALKLFQEKNYDESFLLALDCPPSVKRTQLLLFTATMTEDVSICQAAKEAFESLAQDQQNEILLDPSSKASAKFVVGCNKPSPEQQTVQVPTNWADWLKEIHLGKNIDLLFSELESFTAENKMVDWKNSTLQETEKVLWEILLEEDITADQRNLLRSSLMDFARNVVQDPSFPNLGTGDLYEQMVLAIQTFCNKNNNSAGFLARLLEGLFQIDIDHVQKQWSSMSQWMAFMPSLKLAGDVLELLELFHEYGLPGDKLRDTWNNWVGILCQQFTIDNRLQLQGWVRLGKAAGCDLYLVSQLQEILAEPVSFDLLKGLQASVITIFSLREKAAQRAAQAIMGRNSNLKVKVCTDDRLSEKSKAMASNSDIVIVVTACMSHALTYGIGPLLKKDPIYPRGSGETGIIQALEEYAVSAN